MAFTIGEFRDIARYGEAVMPFPEGPPTEVHSTSGAKTLGAGTRLLAINGTVTVTWGNTKAETFTAAVDVLRGVRPGSVITLS